MLESGASDDRFIVKVPYGLDSNGNEIRPITADRVVSRSGGYYCPDCQEVLTLRRGAKRIAHFAHKVVPERCDFLPGGEGEEHVRAKHRIVDAIKAGEEVWLIRACAGCATKHRQRIPQEIVDAKVEYRLESGLRADVALFDVVGKLRAVVEVFVTHTVSEEKSANLAGIHWFEIQARDILASNEWPLIKGHLNSFTCAKCLEIERERRKKAARQPVVPEKPVKSVAVPVESSLSAVIETKRQKPMRNAWMGERYSSIDQKHFDQDAHLVLLVATRRLCDQLGYCAANAQRNLFWRVLQGSDIDLFGRVQTASVTIEIDFRNTRLEAQNASIAPLIRLCAAPGSDGDVAERIVLDEVDRLRTFLPIKPANFSGPFGYEFFEYLANCARGFSESEERGIALADRTPFD